MELTDQLAYICARCGYCKPVCPVYRVKGWESSSPRAKVFISGVNGISKENASKIFECTLCGRCKEVCQLDLDIDKLFLNMREKHRLIGPESLDKFEETLRKKRNVLNADNDRRVGRSHLVITLGKKKSAIVYAIITVLAYLSIIL